MKPLRILVPMALVIWVAGFGEARAGNYCVPLGGTLYNGFCVLDSFDNPDSSAAPIFPRSGLVQGSDGYFYGTSEYGGTQNAGSVYKVDTMGNVTSLGSFPATGYPSIGQTPVGGLIQGSDGNLYGTTQYGGTNGLGTVFQINPNGPPQVFTTIYQFGPAPDGQQPLATLVQGSDGCLYGTTPIGGSHNAGIVFKIATSGGPPIWEYSFAGGFVDGSDPDAAGLVQGGDGNFYGTTTGGGAGPFHGTVYQITPSGSETVIYSFGSGVNDGKTPRGGVVQGCDGNLYGTTYSGGSNSMGTVFEINLSAGPPYQETLLWQFGGHDPTSFDGYNPQAGLVLGSDGNFYGTAATGGSNGLGEVFQLIPNGTQSIYYGLHGFYGESVGDGAESGYPSSAAALVQGIDGNFYGTTYTGGQYSEGCVYQVQVPLTVNTQPNQVYQITGNCTTGINASMATVAGETCQLQYTASLSPPNWVSTGSPVKSTGCNFSFSIPCTGPQGFYRVQVTP